MNTTRLRTPLYDLHLHNQGKIVDFAGYLLPVHYSSGIIAEHQQTRRKASLFDVSHMGQIRLTGENCAEMLEKLVPSNIQSLDIHKIRYTHFTNEQGGIIDDLMITKESSNSLYLVVNGACKEKDLEHLRGHLPSSIVIEELKDYALIAVQGPRSEEILSFFDPDIRKLAFMEAHSFSLDGTSCWISRSGYTGEDGFEISLHQSKAIDLVEKLLENPDLAVAGLGARDSLRLEAGLPLYGHDLTEEITPIEAGLKWIVPKERRIEANFLGASIILKQIQKGVQKQRVGLLPEGKWMMREGTILQNEMNEEIGFVTSGSYSPISERPIAMGYIQIPKVSKRVDPVFALIRDQARPCQIASLPFLPHRYKKESSI